MMAFKTVSLFSGAGGLDFGFKLTDRFQFLYACDILPYSAETYSYNFQASIVRVNGNDEYKQNYQYPIYLLGDISKLNFNDICNTDVDIVIGGPPCQDFSIIRGPETERQGINTNRGKLYTYFTLAIKQLKPKVFVFENVPGLLNVNNGKAFKHIIKDFENIKYKIIFSDIIDATYFGVAQQRKRLFIIGIHNDIYSNKNISDLIFYTNNILKGRKSILSKYPLTPIEIFEGLPLSELNEQYYCIMEKYVDINVNTKTAMKWKKKYNKLNFNIIDDYLYLNNITLTLHDNREFEHALEEHKKILIELGYHQNNIENKEFSDGSNLIEKETNLITERLKNIPPGENYLFVKGTQWEVEGKMSLVYRRLHPLKPAYTVIARGGGGTMGYHYKRNRSRLTNREKARLQTFPDYFQFKGSSREIRIQIGEAVPPLLSKQIALIVCEFLILSS